MPDGRQKTHARTAALIITSLTTVGLGVATASPAAAAPDHNDIDAVQARVDRLSERAATAEKRHEKARTSLAGTRGRLDRLTSEVKRHRQIMDSLRAQVASTIIDEYDAIGGSSVPASPLTRDSEVLLTNVTVVSEDTGSRGDAMAASNAELAQLNQRRTAVRAQVTMLAGLERNLRVQQERADARTSGAEAVLSDLEAVVEAREARLEAKRVEAAGGPAVAYAKAQVGKSYVWGAAGPSSFDCSGLTMAAWQQAGVSLPHNSGAQYSAGKQISESELKPGDLVFYYSPISHVGMYIGDGQVVNALNPGSGVQISGLHDMPYSGAVRVG